MTDEAHLRPTNVVAVGEVAVGRIPAGGCGSLYLGLARAYGELRLSSPEDTPEVRLVLALRGYGVDLPVGSDLPPVLQHRVDHRGAADPTHRRERVQVRMSSRDHLQ